MNKKCLVLGGNGFIGYTLIRELNNRGVKIKSLDRTYPDESMRMSSIEYCTGDIWDKSFLEDTLNDVDIVYDFIATTMPNTKDISLENEIDCTLRYYNYILSMLYENGIKYYVFPSSGGAIYGNTNGLAKEDDELKPTTPYGVGKQMAENIINYYSHKCGINAYILRIGNVYGSTTLRKKPQGVVDIFIQRALQNEPLVIWGNAENVIRDYVYLEDVATAIVNLTSRNILGVEVYNIGTGKGTSIKEIILLIEREIGHRIPVEYKAELASGINRIVLSPNKISHDINFEMISIEDGVRKTIISKRCMLNRIN